MPVYREDEEFPETDRRPCSNIRVDLVKCLLESDCVVKEKKTPKECIKYFHTSVPDECYALRRLMFECKRSLLDNRMRFRGHKGY